MARKWWTAGDFPCLLLLLATVAARAGEPAPQAPAAPKAASDYLRLVRDVKGQPVEFDTAIVRFAVADRPGGPTVDLVAAVHVGDKKYYEELNRRFRQYDAVLYELIAPAGTKIPEGKELPTNNPISFVQKMLRDVLALQFQLEEIHYNRPNMVHADMSPAQLAQAMRDRGESVLTIFLRMLMQSMAQQDQGAGNEMQLLMALLDRNRALALKRLMAEQFQSMEGAIGALCGSLIEGRNAVALGVLREKLSAGKQKLAIFYGAGHMRDFEKRLRADFGMTPLRTEWLTAWDMH